MHKVITNSASAPHLVWCRDLGQNPLNPSDGSIANDFEIAVTYGGHVSFSEF
jgi:hypothetical protein